MSDSEKIDPNAANDESPKASPSEASGTASTGTASTGTAGSSQEEQLQATREERDLFKEKWLRSEADLDNYRKRSQKEREQDAQYRSLYLAKDLLGPLDNLHRTLEAAEKGTDLAKLMEGIRMVTKSFDEVLTRHAVVAINPVGKPFDPNLHQAIQQVPSAEHPPMTVMAEFERGYTLHERVVRPSSVVVSCAPPE